MVDNSHIMKYAKKRAETLDNFIAAYIHATGLKPDEIILVEKRSEDGLRIEWHCKPKVKQPQKCPSCGGDLLLACPNMTCDNYYGE